MSSETETTVTFNAKGLDSLLRALKDPPSIKVGILGRTTSRSSGTKAKGSSDVKTNAEIGAIHEFGGEHMPQRSFLRIPIAEKLQEYLELSRAFDPDAVKRVIAEGSIKQWLKKVGVIAEQIVHDAFDSRGFGRWKPSNMKYKTVHQTLVETQQLRNSITSAVE